MKKTIFTGLALILLSTSLMADNYLTIIMLPVTQNAFNNIITPLAKAGTIPVPQHPHVTLAVIETQTKNTAQQAEQIARSFVTNALQQQKYAFDVNNCVNQWNNTILLPTANSQETAQLRSLNQQLEVYLNQNGFYLNNLTTNQNYTPHLSLKTSTTGPNRLQSINKKITAFKQNKLNNKLFFSLTTVSTKIK
jgi:hypothetical protein